MKPLHDVETFAAIQIGIYIIFHSKHINERFGTKWNGYFVAINLISKALMKRIVSINSIENVIKSEKFSLFFHSQQHFILESIGHVPNDAFAIQCNELDFNWNKINFKCIILSPWHNLSRQTFNSISIRRF